MAVERYQKTETFHRYVRHGDMLFISGLIAENLSEPMGGQTQQIVRRLDAILSEAGSSREGVIQAMVYITDMGMKDEMNAAWKESFDSDLLPSRATIGVADLGPGVLIEVVFVCVG